ERILIGAPGIEASLVWPAMEGSVRLMLRVGRDTAPGFHELRAVGPGGISNLRVLRIDTLPELREAEPNDDMKSANPVVVPAGVAGVIGAQDIDCYAFQGRSGDLVAIEVEARRLGSPVVPVVRLFGPAGLSLALSQPLRDGSGDCQLSCVLPG